MPVSEFYRKYASLRARCAPFRLKTDFETVKTVAVIDALLNRAKDIDEGASPNGRFGQTTGHNIENYIKRAEGYLSSLERGEFPLKGMYAEPGKALIDHSFIVKDGRLHVFYIIGHIGHEWDSRFADVIGHSVTDDLESWEILPPAITTDPDRFDSYQVWAPAVIERDGTYYMYYTGVNFNVCQAIFLATSKDLIKWEKFGTDPVLTPGEWGSWSEDRWSDCRDPMVFTDDDGVSYMYYCTAKYKDGSLSPALGVASSRDLINWKDEGAYFFDICSIALESPFVKKFKGRYYLFYTNCGFGTAYAVSDDPVKGWKSLGMLIEKKGDKPACPANVPSCAEVFEFKNGLYISSAQREPGCEQYLEIFEFFINEDGTCRVGKRI